MHTLQAKKKDDRMSFVIVIDQTKKVRGHITFPKAGIHKDKRQLSKVAQRAKFRKEIERG